MLRFSANIINKHANTLKISANITAVVAMYISPGRVREYRIVRISDAFCTVKVIKLMYLRLQKPLSSQRNKTNKYLVV